MGGNMDEALRWLKQAEKDLASAQKALKSVLYSKGFRKIITHSIYELVKKIGSLEVGLMRFRKEAKVLDSVYIPSRYPNGIAGDLAPFEYYEKEDAEECINYAGLILDVVRKYIKK